MNSYIQLGLDLKMLEKIDIKIGSQHITGYGILDKEDANLAVDLYSFGSPESLAGHKKGFNTNPWTMTNEEVKEAGLQPAKDVGKDAHARIKESLEKIPLVDVWKHAVEDTKDEGAKETGFQMPKEPIAVTFTEAPSSTIWRYTETIPTVSKQTPTVGTIDLQEHEANDLSMYYPCGCSKETGCPTAEQIEAQVSVDPNQGWQPSPLDSPLPPAIYYSFPPVARRFPTPEQLELARKKETPREEPTTEQLEAQAALNRLTGQAPAEPKKRGRPKKVKAEDFAGLADPKAETGVPVTSETISTPIESPSVPSTAGPSQTLEAWQATPAVETIAEPVKKVIEGLPTPEESLAFRKRMTHYVDDVLSPAGFTSTENIGGPRAKIKLLISKKFGVEAKEMTKWQWQELLDSFEDMIQTSGVQSLITHINEQIGA